jgi:TolB protein
VAFAGGLGSPQDIRAGEVPRGLFVVDADGGGAHQIVSGPIPDAQWSPDGRWIAFTEGEAERSDVFVVHPDGTGLRKLTSSADGLASWAPVWSPDGSTLLLTRSPSAGAFDSNLWIVGVDGSRPTQVTYQGAKYYSYAWSPATFP